MQDLNDVDVMAGNELSPEEGAALLRQMAQKTFELGQAALAAYQAGQLPGSSLAPLCDELLSLEGKLLVQTEEQHEPEIAVPMAETKDEVAEETAVSIHEESAVLQDSQPPACPQCGEVVQEGKSFCTNCGYRVEPEEEPVLDAEPIAEEMQPDPGAQDVEAALLTCAYCTAPIRADAKFCTSCGQSVAPAVAVEEETIIDGHSPVVPPLQLAQDEPLPRLSATPTDPDKFCDNCGRGLAADVIICPDCGGNQFS